MVLFDSLSVRGEAVQYSIELAKRMDSTLVLLMLLSLESVEKTSVDGDGVKNPEAWVKDTLTGPLAEIEKAGLSAEAVVRMGDPSSELMKFLAGSRTIQTIVWGGERDLVSPRLPKKKAHWLVKMKDLVECPVVVPSLKS